MPASFRRKRLASALDIAFAGAIFFSPARQAVGEAAEVEIVYTDDTSSVELKSLPASYGVNGNNGISGALFATVADGDSSNPDDDTPRTSNNAVTVDFSTAQSPTYVFGGIGNIDSAFNGSILVEGNTVTLRSGAVTNNLYGGWGYSTTALLPVLTAGNEVSITGGTVGGDVFGGRAFNTVGQATASGNLVNISAGTVTGTTYGGYAQTNSNVITTVSRNVATLSGNAAVNTVYGGYAYGSSSSSLTASAIGNTVTLAEGFSGTVTGSLYGGYAQGSRGDADVTTTQVLGNTVNIYNGTVTEYVFGGHAANGQRIRVSDNTVNIFGGAINKNVYGGYGGIRGGVENNHVIMTGGEVKGSIYADSSDAKRRKPSFIGARASRPHVILSTRSVGNFCLPR
jgi:hypothetical protein